MILSRNMVMSPIWWYFRTILRLYYLCPPFWFLLCFVTYPSVIVGIVSFCFVASAKFSRRFYKTSMKCRISFFAFKFTIITFNNSNQSDFCFKSYVKISLLIIYVAIYSSRSTSFLRL